MLTNKKLLLTGVITRDSIAWEAARRAQEAGAEIVLTSSARPAADRAGRQEPARDRRRARARRQQPRRPRGGRRRAPGALGRVDGVLHAIAFAPEDALGGQFLTTPAQSAITAFQTSAFSLKALAVALADLYPEEGASIVGMDFDASVAWPVYDWMGVAKAALEATARYLARDLGPRGVRVNLVSAGPLGTLAGARDSGFDDSPRCGPVRRRSAGTARTRDRSRTRSCSCSSDLSRAITGEILHVDGGFHAMGAPLSVAPTLASTNA